MFSPSCIIQLPTVRLLLHQSGRVLPYPSFIFPAEIAPLQNVPHHRRSHHMSNIPWEPSTQWQVTATFANWHRELFISVLLQTTGSSRILYSTGYRDKTSHSHARYRNEARLISKVEQNCSLQWRLRDIFRTAILSQEAVQYFKVSHTHHPLYHGVKRVLYCCTSPSPHYTPFVYLFLFAAKSKSGLLYVRASLSFRFKEGRDRIILIWDGK